MRVRIIETRLCGRRKIDAERLRSYFAVNGCRLVEPDEDADVVVAVTCAFRKNRVEESRALVREISRRGGMAVVTGCYPAMESLSFRQERSAETIALDPKEIERIDESFPDFRVRYREIAEPAVIEMARDTDVGILRLSSGCSYHCSFCGIKKAVGALRSKPLIQIMEETGRLLDLGRYRSIALMGDDVGAYGTDLGITLPELLQSLRSLIEERGGPIRVKIGNMNPWWLISYERELRDLGESGFLSFLHISIQSGSGRILRLMNRNIGRISDVERILAAFPHDRMEFQADYIVGFPTETEDDFRKTLDNVGRCRLDYANAFIYYENEETPSRALQPKVEPEVAENRYLRMLELFQALGVQTTIEDERGLAALHRGGA